MGTKGACFWCGGERAWQRRYDPCHAAPCVERSCDRPRGHKRAEHETTSVRDNVRAALKRIRMTDPSMTEQSTGE